MDIPCDFCLQSFHYPPDFEAHLAEMHQCCPSFCILCYQYFPAGTRRAIFEKHIDSECDPFKIKLKYRVPIARNLKRSFYNLETQHWVYINGRRFFLVKDDRLLFKTDEERQRILSFLNLNIPDILPMEDSPIIHYSSPYVIHFLSDDTSSEEDSDES